MAKSTTSSGDVAARRARAEEMRRQQQAKERRTRLLVSVGGAVVVLAVLAVVVLAVVNKKSSPATGAETVPQAIPSGTPTTQKPLVPVANDSKIQGVQAWDTTAQASATNQPVQDPNANKGIEHDHVDGPVTYAITPPVGGPHNPAWMTCGVYDKAVPSERAVHDMEHGAVWITYRPGLPADQVKALQDLVRKQKDASIQGTDLKNRYVDLSPWKDDSLPSPVVISAWGRQLKVDSATDPRLQQFIDQYRMRADLTYEAGAQCTAPGGDTGIGGQPLF